MRIKIYLASKSPRRQELLRMMGFDFVLFDNNADESFPESLAVDKVAAYIAKKKLQNIQIPEDGVVLTADTVVVLDNQILGKPDDETHAFEMLKKLSGKRHQVITAICLKSTQREELISEVTEVYFNTLSDNEIQQYIKAYQPLDKAGAYGIQEKIGLIAIKKINGSYTNVVGLPTEKLYQALKNFR